MENERDSRPLVELCRVGKRFAAGVTAVENASFSLAAGEFVSLLGPSGCGKSTILRMIAGLTDPTSGEIHRAWESAQTPSNRQVRSQPIGCVFQEPTLLPWASTWENVYLPLRLAGVRRAAAREAVDSMLDRVGLPQFRDAYPRQLSGGMKMRVATARALVTQPKLLLLDEPFAALDEITRQRLNDDLLLLSRASEAAVLFITHSVFESVYLSDRVLVVSPRPGRIAAEITVDLPRERDASLRTTPRYGELCRDSSAALETAMHGEPESTISAAG